MAALLIADDETAAATAVETAFCKNHGSAAAAAAEAAEADTDCDTDEGIGTDGPTAQAATVDVDALVTIDDV